MVPRVTQIRWILIIEAKILTPRENHDNYFKDVVLFCEYFLNNGGKEYDLSK
jgi:hypothetical protein